MSKRRRDPDDPTHPTVPWLRYCGGCNRYRDNSGDAEDTLFDSYFDRECLICRRKKERIAQGLVVPDNSRVGASRAAYRRRADVRVKAEQEYEEYKVRLRENLRKNGVREWELFELMKPRLRNKRLALGLPE
ncbi:MAG: hypothetical protein QNJ14_04270 [Woeseiaceae bacterium]|nr:hypothetical protein [Woeseiaceae bacterium]